MSSRTLTLLGRTLWVALFAAQAMACVLVVPPIEHEGGHCEFTGSSACATCLRDSCQTVVDACCKDASCAGDEGHSTILDALDDCGTGNTQGCAKGIGSGDSTAAAGLRTCVATTCKTACLADAVVETEWSCTAARTKDNTCSTCIYDSCATVLDSCCSDASCSRSSDIAADLGACTGGDKPGCVYLAEKSDAGVEGTVRGCIVDKCLDECMGTRPYRTHQSCQLYENGDYCTCSNAETSSGPDCSSESVHGDRDTKCALGNGTCVCGNYTCTTSSSSSSSGCSCNFRGAAGGSRSPTCRAPLGTGSSGKEGRCCGTFKSTGPSCTCDSYTFPCDEDEFTVASCDPADFIGLLGASVFVDKCSL